MTEQNWFSTLPLRRFRCVGCGYGASRRTEPSRCPMCGGSGWSEETWRAADALARDLDPTTMPLKREVDEVGFLPGVPLS